MSERERKTFEQIFRTHYEQLYLFATHIINDPEECRDIVSDAFADTFRKHPDIAPDKYLAFLYRLVRNKCIDHIRREIVRQKFLSLYEQAYALHEDAQVANVLEEKERQLAIVQEVMQEMTPKTRLILERCMLQRKKYREVAEELGISVSAVRKHIVAALKLLRSRMAKKSE